jgi:NAD(P)-dependent dehydrogenase (short-subunit alcohol dehydrogenase family)
MEDDTVTAASRKGPLMLDFTGKRVLVTGSTRGIGRALVEAYFDAGASVVMNGSSDASIATAIDDAPDGVIGVAGSVATADGCRQLLEEAISRLGGLDILVNNAGVSFGGPIEAIEPEQWDSVITTNLGGAFFCTKYATGALRESSGNILNVASVLGLVGSAYGTAYSAAKGGLVNLTRSLALELAPEIRVNCLCPGGVDTDMLRRLAVRIAGSVEDGYEILRQDCAAQKRIAAPHEIAAAALWLTSDHASFVTGSINAVDGGETAD